jgi:hypothetical protein
VGFVFGIALLCLASSYAHGQRNKDVPHPPPNFSPGEVKPPAALQSDPKSRSGQPMKEAPADKSDHTGGVKGGGGATPKGQQGRQ